MWLKYRFKWNGGPQDDWDYQLWNDDGSSDVWIKEHLNELEYAKGYCYHDHYRGYEYELVEVPPAEFLEREIEFTKATIKNYIKYKTKLLEILHSKYGLDNYDKDS